ncbi:hypothetical protein C8J57DRAFT_106991 [Mycena rebaudengoi]|nr:hypothetical protein C8J57DRAFT_106991 [Mycena rebaudengoi]
MTDSAPAAANTSTSQQEMDALTSRVASLVRLSIDVVKFAVDVQQSLPIVVAHYTRDALAGVPEQISQQVAEQVAEQVSAAFPPSSPTFVEGVAMTPTVLEADHPLGADDDETRCWHVVTVGRDPGLYSSVTESDTQVLGYPSGNRRKKTGLAEALAYYRREYEAGRVLKWDNIAPIPGAPAVATA